MQPRDELELTNVPRITIPGRHDQPRLNRPSSIRTQPESKFLLNLILLLRKNYLIQLRSPRALLLQLVAPFFVCILILQLQNLSVNVASQTEVNPKIGHIDPIPRCFYSAEDPDNCVTIVYGIIGPEEAWIHSVMNYVTKVNQLTPGKDVKYLKDITQDSFTQYFNDNLNKTQIGVIFCTSQWVVGDFISIPCKFETQTEKKLILYNIAFNVTEFIRPPIGDDFKVAHPKHPFAASLKLALDNGIISYFNIDKEAKGDKEIDLISNIKSQPRIEIETQDFPKTHFRFVIGVDVVTLFGCLQFAIPYMLNFLVTSFEIVREKNKRLREGLTVMGMSATAYWFSWTVTCLITNFLITVSTLFFGIAFRYPFFRDTPTPILFMLFFSFGLALQSVAFWISTVSASPSTAYVLSYGVLLLCVILTLFVNNAGICYLVYMLNPPTWFLFVKFLFKLIPAFNFAVLFFHICEKSGNHFDFVTNTWVTGPGFTYSDFFKSSDGEIPGIIEYSVASPYYNAMGIFANIALYLALTWYCDNVISHNRGNSGSPLFFLSKQYWQRLVHEARDKTVIHSPKLHSPMHKDFNYDNNYIENSVQTEQERVLQNHRIGAECRGLRIVGINKKYQSSVLGFKSDKDIHAVRDCYLEVDDGELLSILGHNGAGKTTLIGVLTGLSKPSSGTAEIYNYDIADDMDSIRKFMGVCPQFDILWDELTAKEHLHMFAKLKGISEHDIPDEVDRRLKDVNLLAVKNARAGTFSGGMKRRLSMAIAFIGDPKIVFLDEPTTGMDPKNRRYIWELIQKMKAGRVVILTTHAMEEADILSDRIAVISKGSLRCVGTGLYLKNKYGDGYRLSIVVEREDIFLMKHEIQRVIPSCKILDSSGGSILVGVPLLKVEELKMFFRIMENKIKTTDAQHFKGKIKDWGLSHTTLEEVFMKITSDTRI